MPGIGHFLFCAVRDDDSGASVAGEIDRHLWDAIQDSCRRR